MDSPNSAYNPRSGPSILLPSFQSSEMNTTSCQVQNDVVSFSRLKVQWLPRSKTFSQSLDLGILDM
jgi:hypothetical protein